MEMATLGFEMFILPQIKELRIQTLLLTLNSTFRRSEGEVFNTIYKF